MNALRPDKSLQPTPIGVGSSAYAGHVVDSAWLSFCRQATSHAMKTVTISVSLLASLVLAGCAVAPGYVGPNEVSASPFLMSSRLQYRGFSMARPTDSAWFVRVGEQSPAHAIIRCRMSGQTHTAFVSADLRSLPRAATSEADFAVLCRQDQNPDTNRFAIVSYEQRVTSIQGQWAIEYDLTTRDSGAPSSPGRTLTVRESGYVIKHPTFPDHVVHVRFSERAEPEALDSKVEAEGKTIMKGVRLESEPGKPVA
jgi:hypothetical protein